MPKIYKHCGIGGLPNVEIEQNRYKKYCGYGTEFNKEELLCVPKDVCKGLENCTEPCRDRLGSGEKMNNDCIMPNVGFACTSKEKEECLFISACTWNDGICSPSINNGSSNITTNCSGKLGNREKEKVDVLCGEGTIYNEERNNCIINVI
jgi:hypothetical protein